MKELGMSIMLLLNTLGGSVDPKFSDEAPLVESMKSEIKEMQRKIEWIDATDEDYASKYVRIEKITKDIKKKQEQLKNIEKRAKLKQKWALEDSLEIRKKYPPIKLENTPNVIDTLNTKPAIAIVEKPVIIKDSLVITTKKTEPVFVQKIYVVKPNETLYGIAQNLNISFSKLLALNRFPISYKVKSGEKIKLVP